MSCTLRRMCSKHSSPTHSFPRNGCSKLSTTTSETPNLSKWGAIYACPLYLIQHGFQSTIRGMMSIIVELQALLCDDVGWIVVPWLPSGQCG